MSDSRRGLIAALFAIGFASAAPAQSIWTNAAGGSIQTAGNWNAAPVSSATTALVFGDAAINTASYTATNDTADFQINSLTFNNLAGSTVTVAGSTLVATGTAPTVALTGTGNAIISAPFNITPSGAVNVDYSVNLNMAGNGNLTFSGALGGAIANGAGANADVGFTGTGSGTGTLTFSGGGTTGFLRLNNRNVAFTGGTYNLRATGNDTPSTAVPSPPPSSPFILAQGAGDNVTALITGGTVINSNDNIYFANLAGSTANVTIRGAGTVVNAGFGIAGAVSGRFGPGNSGTGNVTVDQGAAVNCFFVFQSRLAGSNSDMIVDGAGSTVFAHTVAAVGNSGQFAIGNQSTGTWTIRNGGSSIGRNILIGNTAADAVADTGLGNGTLTVTGAGSRMIAGGPLAADTVGQLVAGAMTIGSAGNGRVNVLNGGVVSVNTDGGVTPAGGNVFVGVNASINTGLTARIDVDGAGSQFNVGGQFSTSGGGGVTPGAVTLNLTNGGAINVGGASLFGQSAGGSSTITIDNATFTSTGQLQVLEGAVNLSVLNGGVLTTPAAATFIGASTNAASTATINISGTNSRIVNTNVAGQVQIGGQGVTPGLGTTSVTVASGGAITSPAQLVLFGTANTTLNSGGTINAGALSDGVTGSSVGNIANNTGGVINITGGATQSYSGLISGGGSLVKTGAGTQTLSGANTYSGGTTISAGALLVTNTTGSGIGTGPVTVNGTGVLAGTGAISAPVTIASGGVLTAGTTATGILTLTGATTIASGGTLNIGIDGTTPGTGPTGNHDRIVLGTTGTINITGATLEVGSLTGGNYIPLSTDVVTIILGTGAGTQITGTFANFPVGTPGPVGTFPNAGGLAFTAVAIYSQNSVVLTSFTPVPEPTLLLAICGAAGLVGGLRRRMRRTATDHTVAA